VSAYPSTVTGHMLEAFAKGVATATVLAELLEVRVEVVDAGVGNPTGDLANEDALDDDRFENCISLGREAVAGSGTDLLLLGEMGIGNTTAAAAVATSLYGGEVDDWVGVGSGVDEAGLVRKREAVAQGRSRVFGAEPAEVLRRVGGAELAVLAGACLEARLRSIPVLIDGFVVTAAVAPIEAEFRGGLAHCLAAHLSSEPGHRLLLNQVGLEPIIDLDMRLGEGSGALVALPILRLAIAGVTKVATFEEFGI
jgi:nicotinate-nucleotide--dimethylbenzimidazole phosphoribosyltransferase